LNFYKMNQITDTAIPKYTLKQTSLSGNSQFEIVDLVCNYKMPLNVFLVPHRKDYYMLVFVTEGTSSHWVDMVQYTLKANTVYFTVPHQVQVKEQGSPLIAKMICFTEEFLAIEENELLRQLPIIKNLHNGHELNLKPDDLTFVNDLLNKMFAEYNHKQDWRNGMILAYLRVLLIYMSRLYNEQFGTEEFADDRVLLNKFRTLIEHHHKELHDVAAYAGMLHISAGHLSEVVKQQSGKTAIEHIHERLILEAKRLLFHTESSIKEIAFELGFEDASYFNRFFKRLSDQTPVLFRKGTRDMYH
jgi:AraC family transcriptional activator of pobA